MLVSKSISNSAAALPNVLVARFEKGGRRREDIFKFFPGRAA
jgi:hypothetical protein